MRYLLPILGLVAVVAILVAIKFSQISSLMAMGKQMEKSGPPPETVSSAPAQNQDWEGTLSAVGSITAAKGVVLSNDSPGVVSRIHFESGAVVRQGQVLVDLDSSVERAQLASSRAKMELAALTVGRSRALVKSNTISQQQADNDESTLKTTTTDANALQAQIDRKIVRAPFSGRLGIREINLGQYLNSGTRITVLEAIDTVYVDFTLPQQRLDEIKIGMPVRVAIEGMDGPPRDGTIAAVDPAIDEITRTIKVRAAVPNKEETLRPGMFANVTVVLPDKGTLVAVPVTALVHASYGDSVFVVEEKKADGTPPYQVPGGPPVKVARQQFVRVGESRGDFVAILDGVKPGQDVVSAGAFKLRNNGSIVVNNEVKLDPQLAPHPENN
ncbi:MAG TPA: efflux RND transporter periplasmic adaptor subunit [Polyangiaceae bacterium]|nr:efflux RND transporter periplasmic adaptor subunit [Polyangiaceae bacterium]